MSRLPPTAWMLLSAAALLGLGGPAAADEKADKDDPHAALIGKAAPDFKGDFALNGKPVPLSDLKGKVVLLDFWAVWCGPCVATFPHLRDWHAEYKDRGLEVVGVTSYYKRFAFDVNAGKLKKAEAPLSKDDEQAMLKEFASHHKLEYRLMPLAADAAKKVFEDYKVEGIPQVVLIDRKGKVRLVKVGSGEENAEAIGKKIKELVAEKE